MKCSAERLINALVGTQLASEHGNSSTKTREQPATVVTLSRGYGAQGKVTAQALADRLGLRCCDRSILQEVARRANVDVELVKRLDEHARLAGSDWWTFIEGNTFTQEHYFRQVVKVILSISRTGGVIVGRGAHLILGPARAFRVRIVGTLPVCAARVAEWENLDIEAARQRVLDVDRGRSEYIQQIYGAGIDDLNSYDLILNSDRFEVDEMVGIILFAMQDAGYILPEGVSKTL